MSIIIKPIVTEKISQIEEKVNRTIEREKTKKTKNQLGTRYRYAFKVALNANKIEIKNEIQNLYGVTVEEVNTAIFPGKVKFRNTKSGPIKGSTSDYKKAIVTLKKGETIDFYSNI